MAAAPFADADWAEILGDAVAILTRHSSPSTTATSHHTTFDRALYLLLLSAEYHSGSAPSLVSPRALFEAFETDRKGLMALLARCEVAPVGHRVAVAVALERRYGAPCAWGCVAYSHLATPHPQQHLQAQLSRAMIDKLAELNSKTATIGEATRSGGKERQSPPAKSSSSNTSTGTSSQSTRHTWIRGQCKSKLVSAFEDVHVQLMRPGKIGKKVRIGHRRLDAAPYSGTFDLDTQLVEPNEPDEESFTWVDIVGSWEDRNLLGGPGGAVRAGSPTRAVARGAKVTVGDDGELRTASVTQVDASTPVEPATEAYQQRLLRLREEYHHNSTLEGKTDERLERVLLAEDAKRRRRSYQSAQESSSRAWGLPQTESMASLLRTLELEYGIEIPLAAIAKRVQDAGGNSSSASEREWRTTTARTSRRFVNPQASSAAFSVMTETIRNRIEDGISMNYFNASMFARDELRELRRKAELRRQQRTSASLGGAEGRTSAAIWSGREERRATGGAHNEVDDSTAVIAARQQREEEEEERILSEMAHQHVWLLPTANSPLMPERLNAFLPPVGSEQRSDLMKTNHQQLGLMLSAFLETTGTLNSTRAFSETWVMFVDTRQRIVITIRPHDSVVMGRIHLHFDACFTQLPFGEFVGMLLEASVLHYTKHVAFMYTILDEVQRFLAPSMLRGVADGVPLDLAYSNRAAEKERERRRRFNLRTYNPEAGALINRLYECVNVVVRVVRSAVRKLRRRKTRPRDLTFAALRLLNLVNRQAAVYQKSLTRSRTTGASLGTVFAPAIGITRGEGEEDGGGDVYNDDVGPRRNSRNSFKHRATTGVAPPGIIPTAHNSNNVNSTLTSSFTASSFMRTQHRLFAFGTGVVSQSHSHLPAPVASTKSAAAAPSPHHVQSQLVGLEEAILDSKRQCEEFSERCEQLRSLSSELMSLAMALDTETYDASLALLGVVTALFSPMSWWCGLMGTNFYNTWFFDARHGYTITWLCFFAWTVLVLTWFAKVYHNFDLFEWLRRSCRSWLAS